MKINKSSVFKTANAIYRAEKTATLSKALKMAWRAAKLQMVLAAREVKFQYRKMNGELRQAVGTLKNMLSETAMAFNGTTMFYFDIEKKAFRSFAIAKLV